MGFVVYFWWCLLALVSFVGWILIRFVCDGLFGCCKAWISLLGLIIYVFRDRMFGWCTGVLILICEGCFVWSFGVCVLWGSLRSLLCL